MKQETVSFFDAIQKGNVEQVKTLLKTNVALLETVHDGRRPLHWAVYKGHLKIINILLEQGAQINAKDEAGDTPLSLAAAKWCRLGIAMLLLEKGAQGDEKSNSRLLCLAACYGHVKGTQAFLKAGANIEAVHDGRRPLHWAVYEGHLKIINILLEQGAQINAEDEAGDTPLSLAAARYNLGIAKFLLEQGAQGDEKSKSRLLCLAIHEGDLEATQAFLKADANIEAVNSGRRPLHWAVYNGHLNIIKYLLEQGAQINAKDEAGGTPLSLAASLRCLDIAKFLLEKGAQGDEACKTHLLFLAIDKGDVEAARTFLKAGANKDAAIFNLNITPLVAAIKQRNNPLIQLLVDVGASREARGIDGWTPVMYAAETGNLEALKILLKAGVQLEVRDPIYHSTALLLAAKKGHIQAVNMLLAAGANAQATDRIGCNIRTLLNHKQEEKLQSTEPLLDKPRLGSYPVVRYIPYGILLAGVALHTLTSPVWMVVTPGLVLATLACVVLCIMQKLPQTVTSRYEKIFKSRQEAEAGMDNTKRPRPI